MTVKVILKNDSDNRFKYDDLKPGKLYKCISAPEPPYINKVLVATDWLDEGYVFGVWLALSGYFGVATLEYKQFEFVEFNCEIKEI